MTPHEFEDLLATAQERQNLEVKTGGPLRAKTGFSARAVRAVLGLSNLRDGGILVIGVREVEEGQDLLREGVRSADVESWNTDRLSTIVNNYADPSVQLEVRRVTHDAKDFVVVRVAPFRETPTICKKNWKHNGNLILREGGIYIRSLRKTETAELGTSEDMRELLQLASEKRLADFVRTAERAGLDLVVKTGEAPSEASDERRFAEERGDLE